MMAEIYEFENFALEHADPTTRHLYFHDSTILCQMHSSVLSEVATYLCMIILRIHQFLNQARVVKGHACLVS